MKILLAAALMGLSLSSFATTVEEAVRIVESEHQAECTYKRTTFAKCFGMPQTCFYSLKFKCASNEGDFGLKLKVKESFRTPTRAGEVTVQGTVITK